MGDMDAVGIDFYNQSLTGDVAKSLNSIATDSDHVPCVYINGRVSGGFLNRNSSEARTIGFEWEMSPTLREPVVPSVIVLNPWDSQGNQIADGDGIYPTIRGCGGAGYQAGYVFDRKSDGSE